MTEQGVNIHTLQHHSVTNLSDLISSLERATGPDRELDAAIQVALNIRPEWASKSTDKLVRKGDDVTLGKNGPHMAKTLPKTLFVKIETDCDEPYFVADEDAESLVGMGEKVKIGTYQLIEVSTAEAVVKFDKRKRR